MSVYFSWDWLPVESDPEKIEVDDLHNWFWSFSYLVSFFVFVLSRNTHRGSFCLCSHVSCFSSSLILVRPMNLHKEMLHIYFATCNEKIKRNTFLQMLVRMANNKHVYEYRETAIWHAGWSLGIVVWHQRDIATCIMHIYINAWGPLHYSRCLSADGIME